MLQGTLKSYWKLVSFGSAPVTALTTPLYCACHVMFFSLLIRPRCCGRLRSFSFAHLRSNAVLCAGNRILRSTKAHGSHEHHSALTHRFMTLLTHGVSLSQTVTWHFQFESKQTCRLRPSSHGVKTSCVGEKKVICRVAVYYYDYF